MPGANISIYKAMWLKIVNLTMMIYMMKMTLSVKKYVDVQNSKQDIAINDKANKADVIHHAGSGNLDMKDHTITGIRSSSQDDSAVTLGDVKSLFLPRDGSRQMSGNLNMGVMLS